jgi:hypothetical protein
MITDIICACRVTWEYLDSGLPGMKDQNEPFKDDDFLAMGKLLSTTIEDLILAFTLTSEQFEDPVMWGAVEAMNRYFETGLAQHAKPGDGMLRVNHQEADETTQARAKPTGKGRGKGAGAPAPAPALPSHADPGASLGVYKVGDKTMDASGQETAQSKARSEAKAEIEKNYYSLEWSDRTSFATDVERCNLIGERIRSLMPSKHSLGAVQSFIRNLYNEQVEDVLRPGHSIPALVWKETDGKIRTIQISRKILSNNKQDRLLKVLQKVLNHDLMPEIEYITGLPEMRTPFVLQTITPLEVKLARHGQVQESPRDFSFLMPAGARSSSGSGSGSGDSERSRKRLVLSDQTWVDSTVTLAVRRAHTFSMTEDERDATNRRSVMDVFRAPYTVVDCSIEQVTVFRHLESSLTNFDTLRELGFGDSIKAEKLLVPDSRRKMYNETCHYAVSLEYPDCFLSRNPTFLKRDQWKRRSAAPPVLLRARTQITESQSLDALNFSRAPSEMSVDISRFRANVDPAFRETSEFSAYETKTRERYDDMAQIHGHLTRTQSVPARMADLPVYRPPVVNDDEDETDEKHVDPEEDKRASEPSVEEAGPSDAEQAAVVEMDEEEDDDSAMLKALSATEKVMAMPAPEPEAEAEAEPDSEDTRSGFEKSAMATFWKS